MISPYLMFDGNCEEALNHYVSVLGAKIDMVMRNADAPPDMPCAPEQKNKIMHARFTIGGDVVMASDSPPEYVQKPQGFSVSMQIDDPAEAERKFTALLDGGQVTMPFGKTFWSKGFGMGTDRFGIPWMVNVPLEGH